MDKTKVVEEYRAAYRALYKSEVDVAEAGGWYTITGRRTGFPTGPWRLSDLAQFTENLKARHESS